MCGHKTGTLNRQALSGARSAKKGVVSPACTVMKLCKTDSANVLRQWEEKKNKQMS